MLNPHIPSIERQIFERFLQEVKTLMEQKRIKPPSGFISYAWESPPNGAPNKTLQAWLSQLKKDFAALDIDLFLDIQNINGDMRAAMREIKSRDFVFLIGTPRFKERVEQDILYRLPTFNPQLLPMTGNAVVMVENSDKIYVVEKDNQQLLLIGETTLPQANSAQIEWKQEAGYQRAQSSEVVHQLIEQALKQVPSKVITNVAYEFGLTLDKVKQWPQTLMPLLYQGDFGASFPQDISSNILIRDFRQPNEYYHNFISTSPLGLLPAICPQLQTDKDYARLVDEFLEWKFEVWKEQLSHRFQEELQLYIPALGDYTPDCRNPKPMEEHIGEFMQNHATKVMLLLGGSGSGKTSFGQYLSALKAQEHYTPIWISLPALQNPKENAIPEGLKLLGVPESHIPSFKQKPLLIILDGYDEVKDLGNLYESNHLEQWNTKTIITCRNEFLTAKNYHLLFKPKHSSYMERHLAPFNSVEISAYLQKYIALQHPSWNLARYEAEIAQIEGLRQMIETPFLLHIVADVLPDIIAKHQGKQEILKVTKRALYERFIDQWFEKHLIRWEEQKWENDSKSKLSLLDEGLDLDKDNELEWNDKRIQVLRDYAENFAFQLYSHQLDAVSIKSDFSWVKELFDTKPRAKLIRSACPLKKTSEETYTFIHKSLLEYLITPKMKEEIEAIKNKEELSLAYLNQQLLPPASVQFLVDALIENPKLQEDLWPIIYSTRQNNSNQIAAANVITILNYARVSFSGKDLSHIGIPGADLSGAILHGAHLEGANLINVNLTGAWLHDANLSYAQMSGVKFGEYPSIILKDEATHCCYSSNGEFIAITAGGWESIKEDHGTYYSEKRGKSKGFIHLYDASSFKFIKEFGTEKDGVHYVDFSPDGKWLASAHFDNVVKLWNVNADSLDKTLIGHTEEVCCVQFNPNGTIIASFSGDGTIKLWNVDNGELIFTLVTGYGWGKSNIHFSPDNKLLASPGKENNDATMIKLWNVKTGELFKTIAVHGLDCVINCVRFSPDSKILASGGGQDGIRNYWGDTLVLWSVETGDALKILDKTQTKINCIQFNANGELLAVGRQCSLSLRDPSDTLQLWEIETGKVIKSLGGTHVKSVAFDSQRNRLTFYNSEKKAIETWALDIDFVKSELKKFRQSDIHHSSVVSVDLSADGKWLASGSNDKTVKLWEVTTSILHKTLIGHTGEINALHFSFDSQLLASAAGRAPSWIGGTPDKTVRVWNVSTGQLIHAMIDDTIFIQGIYSIKFSPNGKWLASGSNETLKLWNVTTGTLYKNLIEHKSEIRCLHFNVDSQLLASGSGSYVCGYGSSEDQNNTVKVWDVNSGKLQYSLWVSDMSAVIDIRFNSDATMLTTISCDDEERLWDVKKAIVLKTFKNNGYRPYIVNAHTTLATRRTNLTLQIWANFYPEKMAKESITQLTSVINSLSFQQNAKAIIMASGHVDHSVCCWQLTRIKNEPYVQLLWATHQHGVSKNACIEGVQGLSQNNEDLLLQRGAIKKLLMLSDAGKNVSNSNSNSSSNSQSNNNSQWQEEVDTSKTSSYRRKQKNRNECKIQ